MIVTIRGVAHECRTATMENGTVTLYLGEYDEKGTELTSVFVGFSEDEITMEGKRYRVTSPHNIEAGEYVTIENVLYLATENIPNGEPVIVGQNAVQTSIEQQLYAMKGE